MKKERKRIVMLEFLKRCGYEGDEITPKAWKLLRHVNYKSFIEPMVIADFKSKRNPKGMTVGKLAIKYGINIDQVKYILFKKNAN